MTPSSSSGPTLRQAMGQRILLLDGAMGSLIQEYGYRGNYDALALTHPEVLTDVASRYLQAGADVITTCTFSAQRISQAEYHLEDRIDDINHAAARIAVAEAQRYSLIPNADGQCRRRYVVGDVGPTSKMLSMSDDVNDPAARAISFDELHAAYLQQIIALMEEGVDGILVETIFDTLNAKAAIAAYIDARQLTHRPDCELLLSMTVSDASGRTLSGQTVQAWVASVMHARPLCVGLNCGMGADGMLPYLRQMSACAPCYVSCHPNAGLPNQFGGYDHTPQQMTAMMQAYLDEGLVNMMGGCCGTTPDHIAALRALIDRNTATRRTLATALAGSHALCLTGLEPLVVQGHETFVRVGERCNVAGSRKFLRLISEGQYDEALQIARQQIDDGAQVIDINMDDGLLDAGQQMQTFLRLIASDPAIARVPIMVDSSRFDVIEAGLKNIQGKGIVNSLSLKQGEASLIAHASTVRRLGAALIFMLFDEEGQATDYERRISIAERGYRILVDKVGFDPADIIIDPNVLTVATGMAEHNAYAADFIRATRWITTHLPGVRISGGLSNLSFAFRGNNYLREAMHSVFLHHAIPNGMGMAIMNPAAEVPYRSIPLELRMAITEVILDTYPQAPDELMDIAHRMSEAQLAAKEAGLRYDPKAIFATSGNVATVASADTTPRQAAAQPQLTVEQRLEQALITGSTATIEADVRQMIERGDTPLQIISGPLMAGMNTVGTLFGQGKMFLPQVVKTARTMKKAVEVLQPYFDAGDGSEHTQSASSQPTVLLATVKGDVHDIGKNIVGVVLACNNFRVIDLGVMVPTERIIAEAQQQHVDFVCLSGLITPSLEEMCHVASAMQQAGLTMPLFVGGATTSAIHTAVKIAPLYDGGVFHLTDAARNPVLAMQLLDPEQRPAILAENHQQQELIRQQQLAKAQAATVASTAGSAQQSVARDWLDYTPQPVPHQGQKLHAPIPISQLLPLIDWTYFYWPWRVKADTDEGRSLRADVDALLASIADDPDYALRAITAFYPASAHEGHITVGNHDISTPADAKGNALWHYVAPQGDYVGIFAATVSHAFITRLEALKQSTDDYASLLFQTLGDVLAEAASEYLQRELHDTLGWQGIRPAVGYPLLPDQKQIFHLADLIDFASIGITLTENGAMYPQSSVCGLYIGHPEAKY